MSQHLDDAQLDRYVDGTLPADERRAVAMHLAACDRCRDEERQLRALLARAAALPKRIEPPRDLWAGVREAIRTETGRAQRAPRGRWPTWLPTARLAAAAVVIAALSSAVTAVVVRRHVAVHPDSTRLTGEYLQTEARYERAAQQLEAELEARRTELSPRTVAAVERNLAIVDAAIREARTALQADPGNRALMQMLAASYERKVDLLTRAKRIASGT